MESLSLVNSVLEKVVKSCRNKKKRKINKFRGKKKRRRKDDENEPEGVWKEVTNE